MKRLLVRLTLLTVVVGLGTVAVFEAQRSLRPEPDSHGLPSTARHEESANPIPLVADPGSELPASDDPFVRSDGLQQTSAREPLAATPQDFPRRPIARGQQLDDSAVRESLHAAEQRMNEVRGAADELNANNDFTEPRRFEPEQAHAPLAAGGNEPAGRFAQDPAAQFAMQTAGEEDEQAIEDEVSPPRGLSQTAPSGADEAGAEPAGDWHDNFAPPSQAARGGAWPAGAAAAGAVVGGALAAGADDSRAGAGDAAISGEGTGQPGERQLEGAQMPSLTIEKRAPAEIQVGKPATFAITVRNHGQVPAQGVEVHDIIPQGTQLVSTTPPAKRGPQGELIWDLGTIKPGAQSDMQVQLRPTTEGEIGSVATIHFRADASARTKATRPQLAIEVAAASRVMIGTEQTLKIKISNPGTGAATGVVVTETVPDGMKHAAGGELEFEVGTLRPGEHRELELTLAAAQPGPMTNVLTARGEGNVQTETRTQFEVVAPGLKVDMTGPKRRYLERSAVYTISVSNPGTAPAKEVELVAMLPKGLKFVEANNAGQYDPATGAVYWSLEALPAQETGTVTLTTLPTEPGELKLQIKGRAAQNLVDAHDETVFVEGIAAILFELVDVNDPVEIGGETTYEIRVINQGSKAASNVRIVALVPPQMQPLGASGPAKHVIDGQRVLFDPIAQLAPKADTTYTVKVKALEAGDLRLRVQLVTDEIRTPITKEESTRVYADDE